jgi:hypothetical protein
MIMINPTEERERALLFLKRVDVVHISRLNGIFHNGIILEVGNDFFIIKDRFSHQDSLVLFTELKHPIELYVEKDE